MQSNTTRRASAPVYTHEGARAVALTPEIQLRRLVMGCFLFEDTFYEDGVSVTDRIRDLVSKVNPRKVCEIATEARQRMNLRHVPMLLAYQMTLLPTHKGFVGKLLPEILRRADEPAEFVALYKSLGGKSLSAQTKKGLAAACLRFDEYQLAKYDREDKAWRMRDVMFMVHTKPADFDQGKLHARFVNVTRIPEVTKSGFPVAKHYKLAKTKPGLEQPGTWENKLSAGADKKSTFEAMMLDKELGGMAFLMNLRNMKKAGVDKSLIDAYMDVADFSRVLPFRFLSAARAVPEFEPMLERGMFRAVADAEKLSGRTTLLVDVSPSMRQSKVSAKSDLTREDAAFALAILLREICEDVRIFAFSSRTAEAAPRRGFALPDALRSAVPSDGTYLGKAVAAVSGTYDRLVVMTDEESTDPVSAPDKGTRGYMVNVAATQYGVGYGPWTRVMGFSESIVGYIQMLEREGLDG